MYDTLKILVNNYEADMFFYQRTLVFPDFDPRMLQLSFRRDCAIEKFQRLLDRDNDTLFPPIPFLTRSDLAQPEDLFYFLCDTFSYAYEYVTSFMESLNLDAAAIYKHADAYSDGSKSVFFPISLYL